MQRQSSAKHRDDESASGSSDSEMQHQQRMLQDVDIEKLEKFIKESGRDVNELFVDGESLLNLVCAAGYTELARALLSMRLNVNDLNSRTDRTPLMEAAQNAHLDTVRLLLAHNAEVNAKAQCGNTALHYAVLSTNADVCQVLIQHSADVNAINETGHTPLMEAASTNLIQLAELLIRAGADVNLYSPEFKETALTLAAYKGHTAMCELLVSANASVHHRTDETHTALMEACIDGHVETVRLLHRLGAAVSALPDGYETPLTLAASGGHLELVSALIELGAPIDEPNEDGCTPLMEAAREGHLPVVTFLAARGANVFYISEDQQETALTVAASAGHVQIVEYLLQLYEASRSVSDAQIGAVSNNRTRPSNTDEDTANVADLGEEIELCWIDQGGQTALLEAAMEGHLDVCRLLISHGATLELANPSGDTPLSAACENGGCAPIVQALIEAGANVNVADEVGCTALMKAVRSENVEIIRALLNNGADSNAMTVNGDGNALLAAVEKQNAELTRLLLDAGADAMRRFKDSTNVLIEATRLGALQVVDLLLNYPVPAVINTNDGEPRSTINSADQQHRLGNRSPLAFTDDEFSEASEEDGEKPANSTSVAADVARPRCKAVARRHKLSNTTSDSTANPKDQLQPQPTTQTPQQIVDSQKDTEAVPVPIGNIHSSNHQVMTAPLVNVNAETDTLRESALGIAAAKGQLEIVRSLLRHGAVVDHRDKKGNTPLILASIGGHVEVCRLLLAKGANVDAHTERAKDTALIMAAQNGREACVQLLAENGANIEHRNFNDYTALCVAAMNGHRGTVDCLLSNAAEINARTNSKLGISPLMLAAMQGHAAVVTYLLDHGADVNAQIETNRNTALTLACIQGRTDVVRLLIERRANAEHRSKNGFTPLMEACHAGYTDVVRTLLELARVDVNALPVPGTKETALTIAAERGHRDIVELLIAAGAHLEARTKRGATALWLAAMNGHLEIVQRLVVARADLYAEDARRLTPLGIAYRKGHVKVVKYLCRIVQHFPNDSELKKHVQALEESVLAAGVDLALTYAPIANALAVNAGVVSSVQNLASGQQCAASRQVPNASANANVMRTAVRHTPLQTTSNVAAAQAQTTHVRAVLQGVEKVNVDCVHSAKPNLSALAPSNVANQTKLTQTKTVQTNKAGEAAAGNQQIGGNQQNSTQSDVELLRRVRCCFELVRQAKERQANEANRIATQLLEQLDAENERELARKDAQKRKKEKKKLKKLGEKQRAANASEPVDSVERNDDDEFAGESSRGDENRRKSEEADLPANPDVASVEDTVSFKQLAINESPVTSASNALPAKGKRSRNKQQAKATDDRSETAATSTAVVPEADKRETEASTKSQRGNQNDRSRANKQTGKTAAKQKGRANDQETSVNSSESGVGASNVSVDAPADRANNSQQAVKAHSNTNAATVKQAAISVVEPHERVGQTSSNTSNSAVKSTSSSSSGQVPSTGQASLPPNAPLQCTTHQEARSIYTKAKRIQIHADAVQRLVGRNMCQLRVLEQLTGTFVEVENCQKRTTDRVMAIRGPPDNVRCCSLLIVAALKYSERPMIDLANACKRELLRSEIPLSAIGQHPQQLTGELSALLTNIGRSLQPGLAAAASAMSSSGVQKKQAAMKANPGPPVQQQAQTPVQPQQPQNVTKWSAAIGADRSQPVGVAASNRLQGDFIANVTPSTTVSGGRPVAQVAPISVTLPAAGILSKTAATANSPNVGVQQPPESLPGSSSAFHQLQASSINGSEANTTKDVRSGPACVSIGINPGSSLSVGLSGASMSLDMRGDSLFSLEVNGGTVTCSPDLDGSNTVARAPGGSAKVNLLAGLNQNSGIIEREQVPTGANNGYSPFLGPICIDVAAMLRVAPNADGSAGSHTSGFDAPQSSFGSIGQPPGPIATPAENYDGSTVNKQSSAPSQVSAMLSNFDSMRLADNSNVSYAPFGNDLGADPGLFSDSYAAAQLFGASGDRSASSFTPFGNLVGRSSGDDEREHSYASLRSRLWEVLDNADLGNAGAGDAARSNAAAQQRTSSEYASNANPLTLPRAGPSLNPSAPAFDPKRIGLGGGNPNHMSATGNPFQIPNSLMGAQLGKNSRVGAPTQPNAGTSINITFQQPPNFDAGSNAQPSQPAQNSVASASTQTVQNVNGATIMVTNVNNNNIYYCTPPAPTNHQHTVGHSVGPYGPLDLPASSFNVDSTASASGWLPPGGNPAAPAFSLPSNSNSFEPSGAVFPAAPYFATNVTVLPSGHQQNAPPVDVGLPVNLNVNLNVPGNTMVRQPPRNFAPRTWRTQSPAAAANQSQNLHAMEKR